jgi:hypothetical protein
MDELETTGLSQSDLQPIPESPKNLTRIRLDLFHAAYTLAFGTRSQEADALETISHLLFVLTHQNMKEEKQ